MKMELPPERYRLLPVQLVEVDGGLILKRGMVEVRLRGEGAAAYVRRILEISSRGDVPREDLTAAFDADDQPAVEALLDHLRRRRILVPADAGATPPDAGESGADIFYWHFGESQKGAADSLAQKRLLIIGVNEISLRLARSLRESGASSIEVRDYPLLRNLRLFDAEGKLRPDAWPPELVAPAPHPGGPQAIDPASFDCLVATSDFGGLHLLRPWNEFCVLHERLFLPVVLQDLVGYVGPLVVPGETACFECFRQRRNTHLQDPQDRHRIEELAFEGQGTAAVLSSMTSMIGDIAALELIKFFVLGPSVWKASTLIEVNPLVPEVSARKVLKQPRCPVCTPLAERPALAIARSGSQGRRREGTP